MKKIVLFFSLCVSLLATPPFTLENLKNLRVYMINGTEFIDKKQESLIKKSVEQRLKSVGINLNAVDSSTFIIKIESVKIDKTYVVNVRVSVAEEIVTNRKDNVETLAFTYVVNDFMDTQEPYQDSLESIDFLLDEFIELYLEDME